MLGARPCDLCLHSSADSALLVVVADFRSRCRLRRIDFGLADRTAEVQYHFMSDVPTDRIVRAPSDNGKQAEYIALGDPTGALVFSRCSAVA